MLYILTALIVSLGLAMSTGLREPANFPFLSKESDATQGEVTQPNVVEASRLREVTVYPRPAGALPPDFSGPENETCYNYGSLLVRNGVLNAGDPLLQNSQDLLRAIYSMGRVIIHHTASDAPVTSVINDHIGRRGWSDTGYHFLIDRNGGIHQGRSLFVMGANAGQIPNRPQDCADNLYEMARDNDFLSIGVAIVGNLSLRPPSTAQVEALGQLIQSLKRRFDIREIVGHQHVQATDCPGHYGRASLSRFYDELSAQDQQARQQNPSPFLNRRLICYSCQ
jgi:hypothetical protein